MNPSEIIDSRYRLERLLGTGGMSEVWLAEDQRLGRWVAVKLLRESFSSGQDGDLIASFDREARLIARLQHPNIVAVYDTGAWDGRHYLVMEYVHGYSMRRLLEARGRLTEAEATNYGALIADAIEYAHQQGVIHCDIKPENILVTEQGVPKVVDFGVADTLSRTLSPDQARDILGTIAYLAPEVIQGAPADQRSDVYSLGLTIYEMVAGRLPFAGSTPAALTGQRLANPAPSIRSFNSQASPALEAVLARALSLSQSERFQSSAEFAAALRRAGQSAPVVGAAAAPSRPVQNVPAPLPDTPLRQRHPTRRVSTNYTASQPAPETLGGGGGGAILAIIFVVLLAVAAGVVAAVILTHKSGGSPGATPTPQASATAVATTAVPTSTPTNEPTSTATATDTPSPSATATPTREPSRTPTQRPSRTGTPESPTPGLGTPSPAPSPGGSNPLQSLRNFGDQVWSGIQDFFSN